MLNVMQQREMERFLYLRVIFKAFRSSTDTTKKVSAQQQNLMYLSFPKIMKPTFQIFLRLKASIPYKYVPRTFHHYPDKFIQ